MNSSNNNSSHMNDIESSPYAVEHSLITKAVRRGNVDLVEKTFNYLINIAGQRHWLKNRLAVIGYEECWQYANLSLIHISEPTRPY